MIFTPLRVFLHQTRLTQNTEDTLTLGLFQEEFNKVTNKTIEVLFTEEQRECGPINIPRSKGNKKREKLPESKFRRTE